MRWAGHVARVAERRGAYRVLVGKPEGKNLQNLDLEGRIIFKWTFKKLDEEVWTAVIWLRTGTGGWRL
jgi:hypothetical protein